ncbi:MAG: hypothetical protein DI598_14475, partial [Pseudopedobacter saltans]
MSIQKDNILYGLVKPRFSLWKIFFIAFSISIVIWIIGIGSLTYLPKTPTYDYKGSYKDMLTPKAIGQQLISI